MKPERNAPCPCGSGKTFEKCCLEWYESAKPKVAGKKAAPTAAECGQLEALFNAGRLAELESQARLLLEEYPESGFIWNLLGASLQMQGKDGLAALQNAAKFLPDDADVHSNLGNVLGDLGRLDEAEACYRRALQIDPHNANVLSNLGATLSDLGRPDEAEASYRRALQIKPGFAEAHSNLALLFNAQGNSIMALDSIKQSLKIKETLEAKNIFVTCVKRLHSACDDSEIRAYMVRALTEPWCRPDELARSGIDFVKLDPGIGAAVARAADAWPAQLPAQDLFGPNGLDTLASDRLLCTLLDSALICDIEMEHFLTMVRRTMLDAATGMIASDAGFGTALGFCCALARQCFVNEYVFSHTEDEIRKAGELRDSLAAALEASTQTPALWVAAVAAYFPLYAMPFAARLQDTRWPEAMTALLVQQVREPGEERQLRATIPRLTSIEDEVSLLVQNQYEENPYPRWTRAAPAGKASSIAGYLRRKFPLVAFKRYDKSGGIDILIAGCGTGQHSIQTARRFQGAQVLAVDLSLSSLSYAKRKTRELGLAAVEYAQADLLQLGSLERRFDIIESVGVLHHMADPWAGWRALLPLLRPDGFMMLGFYSEAARQNIVLIRNFIAARGYGSTADEIRRCRQDLMDLDKSAGSRTTTKSTDFFSISACRDLLFHVQEHRMTLPGIETFLKENNLAFIGFEIDADILRAYKLRFPDDRAATDLGTWHIFENENPGTFAGMYQFWVQKID